MFYIYYHFFFHWTETAPVQEVPPPRPPLPTEATAPPPRPPLPSDEMVEVQQVLEQPPEDNRMAVRLSLTSCNDCSQFSTLALPIINLFNPPPPPPSSVCLSVVFDVSWVLQLSQEKMKEIILISHSVLFLRPKVCINCCFANASGGTAFSRKHLRAKFYAFFNLFFCEGVVGGGGQTECIK